jgi:hypothetical protein
MLGGIYEYAVELTSGVMIYIPSFIKVGLGIQRLLWRIHTDSKVISYA